jgi:hypothetical protein
MKRLLLYCIFHCGASTVIAQGPDFLPGQRTITLSAKTLQQSEDLPFDNPFSILVNDLEDQPDVVKAKLSFGEGPEENDLTDLSQVFNKYGKAIRIVFPAETFFGEKGKFLKPNTTYTYKIVLYDNDDNEKLTILRSSYTRTKFGDYVKLDFGFGYAPNIEGVFGFSTAHIYFVPINNDADLGKLKGFRKFWQRSSFYFGLSPLTIYTDTKQPVNNLSGAGNFVYGYGLRSPFYGWKRNGGSRARTFLQPMRLVIGSMVFKQTSENPLITTQQVKQSFYVGISYDLNIAGLFTPIAKFYTP